jgi:ATP/maltotriose-dependent transcriptional regulator MalT/DNA-binding SARP family transcriptional activator
LTNLAEPLQRWAAPALDTAASTQHGQRSRVIRRKLVVPDAPAAAAPRERLNGLLRGLVEAHRVVAVTATPGAGKSVAVAHASRTFDRVTWLSVDATDAAAPGRLVTYLEEALAAQLPSVRGVATAALAAGLPHAEAAGLLAEAVPDTDVVFVLDDLERLNGSQPAWEVIASIVRYAPANMRFILISRRAIPTETCCPAHDGGVARVGDADLAFTVAEARIALQRLGRSGADATAAVAAAGGWVTGVLFDAWRDHTGGGPDDLGDYLAAHILGELDAKDREFLITTSLLEDVTVECAVGLGVDDAAARLASLQAAPIPALWSPDRPALRCHSRFREYLRGLLDHRGQAALRELRAAHGRLLARKGFHEEAVEELLAAGALAEAFTSAKHAILGVVERMDFVVADRWIETLSPVAPEGDVGFAEAQLMLAIPRDDYLPAAGIVDELAATGLRDRLAATSDHAAALMAYCYIVTRRLDDAHAVLDAATDGPAVNAVRYALAYAFAPEGAPVSTPPRPEPSGGSLDALLYWTDYVRGELKQLADDPPSSWTTVAMGPGRIGALRAIGRTAEALQQYEEARRRGLFAGVLDCFVGPDVLLDAGQLDQARAALTRGRKLAQERGRPGWAALHHIAAAKLALRADRDPARAIAALDEIARAPAVEALVRELAQTWRGLAALLRDDQETALSSLRAAVAGMQASGRILELPTAAVYLAEAEWRADNPDAADRAADIALQAAHEHGTNHILLQALADYPAVVARRIDAEPHADSAWHAIGRALTAQGVAVGTRICTAIELVEFGRTAIILNGIEVRPKLAKCYELLGFLAAQKGAPASRDELLNALFDARDDESARSYLRKTIIGVRQLLPDDTLSVGDDGRVGLSPDVALACESTRLEQKLAAALRLQGSELVETTEQALAPLAHGEYFPGVRSAWVDERRQQLAELATTARAAAAEAAYAADRYHDAQRLAEAVLAADPLREATWRTLMRIRSAVGDYDGVITTYTQCERALRAAQIAPAASTRALLTQLRR